METIKITYADFWPEWEYENFIEPILAKYFNIKIDQKNPDILFHSIFGGMRETPRYKCKKVLFLGENYRPERFGSNYSISFDPDTNTNFRLPLWQVFLILKPELKDRLFERRNIEEFDTFAAFVVSNPSNPTRNSHFDQLNSYKRVNSYGKVRMNDLGLRNASAGKYWRDAKDEFFLSHTPKFMMAYENTAYPWYCTEKIMDAFLAGSVPLYWGDPKVVVDWNLDAFINISKLGGSWLEVIKKLDQDKYLFDATYFQPIFKLEQKNNLLERLEEFENWLLKIVKN